MPAALDNPSPGGIPTLDAQNPCGIPTFDTPRRSPRDRCCGCWCFRLIRSDPAHGSTLDTIRKYDDGVPRYYQIVPVVGNNIENEPFEGGADIFADQVNSKREPTSSDVIERLDALEELVKKALALGSSGAGSDGSDWPASAGHGASAHSTREGSPSVYTPPLTSPDSYGMHFEQQQRGRTSHNAPPSAHVATNGKLQLVPLLTYPPAPRGSSLRSVVNALPHSVAQGVNTSAHMTYQGVQAGAHFAYQSGSQLISVPQALLPHGHARGSFYQSSAPSIEAGRATSMRMPHDTCMGPPPPPPGNGY